jgi:hypothetical protein
MKVVMSIVAGDRHAEDLDTQVSFHLNAGVDVILVADGDIGDDARSLLGSHVSAGSVHVVPDTTDQTEHERRTNLVRRAATEHDADWVLDSRAGEFWWPRGRSLKDVLVAIPARYTVVQALVRRFVPDPSGGPSIARSSLTVHSPKEIALGHWLRPVYRADPALVLSAPGVAPEAWRVPLRAWYPVELFDCAGVDAGEALTVADKSLVSDRRLAEALARLRKTGDLSLPVPDLVADAEYAVECAVLGETDLAPLETYVADLERRLAALEARVWPRARRALRQVLRRSG